MDHYASASMRGLLHQHGELSGVRFFGCLRDLNPPTSPFVQLPSPTHWAAMICLPRDARLSSGAGLGTAERPLPLFGHTIAGDGARDLGSPRNGQSANQRLHFAHSSRIQRDDAILSSRKVSGPSAGQRLHAVLRWRRSSDALGKHMAGEYWRGACLCSGWKQGSASNMRSTV